MIYGTLRIYLRIGNPDPDDTTLHMHKKVCIAEKVILREDCEQYIDYFKNKSGLCHVDRFRMDIIAEWSVRDTIFA